VHTVAVVKRARDAQQSRNRNASAGLSSRWNIEAACSGNSKRAAFDHVAKSNPAGRCGVTREGNEINPDVIGYIFEKYPGPVRAVAS
jgi:hypothetical protein